MNRKQRRQKARIQAQHDPKTLNLEAQIAIQAAAEGESSSLPTVTIEAYGGGPMRVGKYPHPVVVDVDGVEAGNVPLLENHDPRSPIGHGDAQGADGKLHVSGVLSGSAARTAEIVEMAGNGFPWQASIGLDPTRTRQLKAGKKATVNGHEILGPALIVEAGRLREVSLTPVGADASTSAAIAAEFAEDDMIEEQKPVQAPAPVDAGLDPYGERERQRLYAAQVRDLLLEAVDDGTITAAEAKEMEAEYAQSNPSIESIQLTLLRKGRYAGRSGHGESTDDPKANQEMLEAAFSIACGVESGFEPRVLEAARTKYPQGIGFAQLLNIVAKSNGYRGGSWGVNREVLEFAMPPMVYAASSPSTYRVSGILSNVANKMIVDSFNAVESAWRAVAAIGRVRDFKEISSYALTGDFTYKKVSPGGEIQHAVAGEETYGNKADTYARLFGITRTDLINDDLSAFDRVRMKLGRGAALALNQIFWTEFNADAANWWTAGRGNYFEGADSALDIDSLGTAEQLFRDQVDPDGNPLGVQPRILLVGNGDATNGRKLVNDTEMRNTTSDTSYTTGNPWAGMFELAISSYVNNTAMGGIATQWFLMADPMDLPTIEIVFLNGQQTPFIEQAAADFDQLGIQLRGYHDFGTRKQEYRSSVRSKGAV